MTSRQANCIPVINNDKMKINYVIEDFSVFGGIERIVSQKANILATQYGYDVTIISVYKDDRPVRYPLDKSIRIIHLDVPWTEKTANKAVLTMRRITTLVKAVSRLNKAVKETKPDIIFFATTLSALLLPFCRTNAKKVFEAHTARKFTPYNRLFTLTERRADAVICLTQDDAGEYKTARRVEVIPNFIDNPQRHAGDYAVKRAVAVGRLVPEKGFDRLIRCWKAAVGKHPGWQLDIYGEGPTREKLQGQINSLGLENSVNLRGICGNMTERYADYSLHLMTSHYEGLGIVLIEAQSVGLPSVTFDYEYGARDIVADGVTGIIVPQDDEQAFTAAIQKMMYSEELRRKYGTEAVKAAGRFSRAEVMEKWNSLIKELE